MRSWRVKKMNMITKEQFENAKQQLIHFQKIVDDYNKQEADLWRKKRKEIEDACPEHEYRYTNAKWQSVNQRECINCGKVIE